MADNLLDPVLLFFALGMLAGVLRSDLRLPEALYETLSLYLLIAIGLKGGVELHHRPLLEILPPATATLLLGGLIPLTAYPILRYLGRFSTADSAALAAHYGSVSAVTFAVVLAYLTTLEVAFEPYVPVLLVLLEVPAIGIGIALARLTEPSRRKVRWGPLVHEVFLGRSIYLLLGGLLVGWISGPERMAPIEPLFMDLFKGALALFLLEMGLVASRRLGDLRRAGPFLVGFALVMPFISATFGIAAGWAVGLSIGGTTVLATLAASASYIAAPAAVRIAIPEANPAFYLTASLGVTFPFNIIVGIPVYYHLTAWIYHLGG